MSACSSTEPMPCRCRTPPAARERREPNGYPGPTDQTSEISRHRFSARFGRAENRRVFGKCNNPHGHGHNYVLEVTVAGDPDPATGMVLDLKELKEILNRQVVEPYDHRFLNYEVAPFDKQVPTTENIALDIWRRLQPQLNGGGRTLHAVRVYETPDLYVDYFGESECSA